MIEEDPLSASRKRKLRRELHAGAYGVRSRADLAKDWLREQEVAEEWRARLTLDAAVVAAAVGVIGLLVMLGIIK